MKIRNPKGMNDLLIKKGDNVLDVGGGDSPHYRANIVVDKFATDNTHRSGDIKVLKSQKFIEADGEQLPFKDNEFDYVICKQVLEHVEHPLQFVKEQARVAKMGYMETPSLLCEYVAPKQSHKWVILEIDNKLVMYEKEFLKFNSWTDFGVVFLEHLPKISIGYKILERTHAIFTVNYEWKNEIEILINPEDPYYLNHFTKPWDEAMCDHFFVRRSYGMEMLETMKAMFDIMRSVTKSKLIKSRS